MTLSPKPGFDWAHVAWGRPDSPRSVICSYCSAFISDEDCPMIMWKPDGSAAQFCDECQEKWWGVKAFDDPEPEDNDEESLK